MRWRGDSDGACFDTNPYPYSDCRPHSHSDPNSDANTHSDIKSYSDANTYTYSDTSPLNLLPAPGWPLVNTASNDAKQSDSRSTATHWKDSHRLRLWQLSSTAGWLPSRATIFSGCGTRGFV